MEYAESGRQEPCELCHTNDFAIIAQKDRRGHPLTTVTCRQCGLVSHESIPTDRELNEYYASQYRQDYHGQAQPAAHRVIRAWGGGQWLRNRLKRFVKSDDRICEIGAGIGCTVKAFELAGYEATGIEPGEGFHEFARNELAVKLERCNLFDLAATPTYDFILLVHVIEHFRSPRQALVHIRQLMQTDARLYVECPNIAGPHAAPGKQFHYAHIYNFSPETLIWLAQSCGLDVHTCLSKPNDRVLRYVFVRQPSPIPIETLGGYSLAKVALQRYTRLTYHLRPCYLADRIWRDIRFASNHIVARWRMRQLARKFQKQVKPLSVGRAA